jgi:hypothetical protein
MTPGKEEQAFEIWMLSDLRLCKDIAEFAAFALALRGGAYAAHSEEAPPEPDPALQAAAATDLDPASGPAQTQGESKLPMIIVAIVISVILVVALMALLP